MTALVLASQSPARLKTLRAAGVDPYVLVSGVDEAAVLATYPGLAPDEVPLVLARAKADAVVRRLESGEAVDAPDDALVLGCDSVLELDGEVHGRPADAAEALARWRRMRGRSGVLHTGHWLVDLRDPDPADGGEAGSGATLGATSSTVVHFADVSDAELEAYFATGEPLQVAGAFTTDGLGGAFVRGIEGDHHTVVGVSLPLLRDLVAECGVPWVSLWSAVRSGR